MIIHPAPQGSVEWFSARAGIPTASNFDKIITATGKPSSQAEGYMFKLIAERMLGVMDEETSSFMQRGSAMEKEAVAWYEFERGVKAVEIGFITTDSGRIGCSPDRLVGDDGLLEVKCPAAHTQIAYLLVDVSKTYTHQIQGQLLVTGRKWVDWLSYCPGLPQSLIRIERDEEFINLLSVELDCFCQRLNEQYAKLLALLPVKTPPPPEEDTVDDLSF